MDARTPSSSALVFPICPKVSITPALYLPAPTHLRAHPALLPITLPPPDGQPQGGVGLEEAVEVPQKHLVHLVAVTPRDSDQPPVSGDHHDIHHVQRDKQQNN